IYLKSTFMHRKFLVLGLSGLLTVGSVNMSFAANKLQSTSVHQTKTAKDLIGRWDITLDENGKPVPSWLEVKLSGSRTLVGTFVGVTGSARPVSEVHFDNGKFSFEIPPQWEGGDQNFVIEGELVGNEIQGTIV